MWGTLSGTTFTPEDWEYTNTGSVLGSNALNVLNAACRPATFLNWVRNGNSQSTVGKGIWAGGIVGQTGAPGMCAHANSGGAGAVGYALAWYNASAGGAPTWGGGYIDKAVMENGPVFSDIEQGCEVTNGVNSNKSYICSNVNDEGITEPGCNFTWGTGGPTNYNLEYIDGDQSALSEWTQLQTVNSTIPACGSRLSNATTPPGQNAAWYNMSIVNFPTTGQQPSFSYPRTAISGWLCQSVSNLDFDKWNNSAPQGQLFFQNFTSASDTAILSVNGVNNCLSNEYVESGSLTYAGTAYGPPNPLPAYEAIIKDMTTDNAVSLSCATMGKNRAQ